MNRDGRLATGDVRDGVAAIGSDEPANDLLVRAV